MFEVFFLYYAYWYWFLSIIRDAFLAIFVKGLIRFRSCRIFRKRFYMVRKKYKGTRVKTILNCMSLKYKRL